MQIAIVLRTMFFLEGSDSNALRLVYGSDGDNPESLGESGPRP